MQSSALTIFAACVLAATTINALPLSDSTLLRPGICPGSPAAIHAKSQLTLTFPSPCDVVAELVFSRATSDSWIDPHNGGNYTLLSDNRPSTILMSRAAGSQAKTPKGPNYDDQVKFTFLPTENWGRPDGGCQVRACSESHVTSVLDFGTNYCNMHDLICKDPAYCGKTPSNYSYTEEVDSCGTLGVNCKNSVESTCLKLKQPSV